jgi:transcriptional regulator with XRE-family HTH domain
MANPIFSAEYEILTELLIEARRRAGLSQRALGARLGKSASHICMIERRQRRVEIIEFWRMATILQRDPQSFIDEINDRLDTPIPRSRETGVKALDML